ncbi:MAG: VOC family protein [Balneola sp.]
MKLNKTRHVLAVPNLKISSDFYKTQLGFSVDWEDENWCFLYRDSFYVMLGECKDAILPSELGDHQYFAYVDAEDIDKLYNEYSSKEIEITSVLADKPWGQREFGIKTIDGHRIMFGKEL